jgi:hypothetical protein
MMHGPRCAPQPEAAGPVRKRALLTRYFCANRARAPQAGGGGGVGRARHRVRLPCAQGRRGRRGEGGWAF